MPFFRFVGIVTPCHMTPFETNAHLVDVDILIANEETHVHLGKMIEEGCHTPITVILLPLSELCGEKIGGIDHMETFLQHFKPISRKTLFYERISEPRIVTPIAPHGWLTLHPHVQKNTK